MQKIINLILFILVISLGYSHYKESRFSFQGITELLVRVNGLEAWNSQQGYRDYPGGQSK